MSSKKVLIWFLVAVVLGGYNSIFAAEKKKKGLQISGFLTTMAVKGSNDLDTVYSNGIATEELVWNSRNNHIGIQFANQINPQMKVAAQFISHGGDANNSFRADWAYIDYSVLNNLRLRIGKYKIPQFIVSDYQEVGYAYPWVRPPEDVYATNPLVSLNGIDMLYILKLKNSKILIDLYYGEGSHNSFIQPATVDLTGGLFDQSEKGKPINFDTRNSRGIAIKFVADTYSVRASYFDATVSADLGPEPGKQINELPGAFGSVGFTMDVNDIIVYAEIIQRNTDPGMAGAFPDQTAGYLTLGYCINKFLPTFTYSEIRPGIDESPLAIEEKSYALGFRYDILDSADIKFEALHVVPKEGNHGLFNDPVEKGNIYTVSIDVIF